MRYHLLWLLALTLLACGLTSEPAPVPTPTPLPTPTAVPVETLTFKVPSGQEYHLSLSLRAGSRIEYRFQSNLDLNFSIEDPFGAKRASLARVERAGPSTFVADATGVHTLVFDNSFSLFTSKVVDLTYRAIPAGGR